MDLADDLLQDIFKGRDSGSPAVFVDNGGHVVSAAGGDVVTTSGGGANVYQDGVQIGHVYTDGRVTLYNGASEADVVDAYNEAWETGAIEPSAASCAACAPHAAR